MADDVVGAEVLEAGCGVFEDTSRDVPVADDNKSYEVWMRVLIAT